MGITTLHFLLWLLTAFAPSTQELTLKVTPKFSAACGQRVTLDCEVPSSQHGLSVKHMEWYQDNYSLCTMSGVTKHAESGFNCSYQQGKLSLLIKKVNPMNSGNSKPFWCKLRSNKGTLERKTTVELRESCGQVKGFMTEGHLSCNFTRVYPDGEVHWFHGSHRLHGHQTTEHVDKEGWLVIHSYLEKKSSESAYNCSLWSPTANRYITSALVRNSVARSCIKCGAGSLGPAWTVLIVTLLLAVSLK